MPIKNFKVYFQNRLRGDITFIQKNKKLWIIFLICLGVGFLSALGKREKLDDAEEVLSLLGSVECGKIEYGKLAFYLLLIPLLAEVVLCLATGNFYILFAVFSVTVILFSKAFFFYIFKLFYIESFLCAVLQTVFALLLFVTDMFVFVRLFSYLLDLIGIPCRKRMFVWTPYRCHGEKLKKYFLDALAVTLLANTLITVLFSAICFLFCR